MDKKQYNKIIIRSQDIAEKWKKIPAPQRGEFIRQFGEQLRLQKELLAKTITKEARKIKTESLGEVQEAIDKVKRVLPFIEHVSLNASAPIILRRAKPWALETMQEVPELVPFVETTVNRPSYLKNQKEIDDFAVAEQQAEVESSDIIPDYPHQGTSQGQEGEFAKDILQREIVDMLRTSPDANAIGLHRWGTEGSPQSPYVAMILSLIHI